MNRRTFLCAGAAAIALPPGFARSLQSEASEPGSGRAISIEDFGAATKNSPRANTAAINRAIAAAERGGGSGNIFFPPRSYPVHGRIHIKRGNVALLMAGTTLIGTATGKGSAQSPGVRLVVSAAAANVRIIGGHLVEASGLGSTYLFDLGGRNIDVQGTTFEKRPAAYGGYTGYIRAHSDGIHFDRFLFRGGNGIYIEGSNHVFSNFDIEAAPPPGGDDGFALKAVHGNTQNIRIGPGRVKNYAAVLSIGSEIGLLRSDDPARSRAVRNVWVGRIEAEDCSHVALIKPGAISAYDYRDGLVEDVAIEDVSLSDPTGEKFQRGLAITASRGAKVRRVTARNIRIRARAHVGRGIPTVGTVDCFIVDNGGRPASISEITVQASYEDPFLGARNGSGRPGHPVQYVARAALQTVGKGHMTGLVLDIEGNGSKEIGILIGAGLDGAVEIRRAVLHNVSANPASAEGRGGIFSRSRVRLGNIDSRPRNGKALAGPVFR